MNKVTKSDIARNTDLIFRCMENQELIMDSSINSTIAKLSALMLGALIVAATQDSWLSVSIALLAFGLLGYRLQRVKFASGVQLNVPFQNVIKDTRVVNSIVESRLTAKRENQDLLLNMNHYYRVALLLIILALVI